MKKKKFKLYRKIYPKARAFAKREYVEPYERDALNKGYYNGYVDGAIAMFKQLPRLEQKDRKEAEHYLFRVLGEPTIIE